jgi:DNA-binding transcriptional LysR family regulator
MELDNTEAAKKMVERRLGIALLPRTSVAHEIKEGTLALVHVKDAPPMAQQIVLIRRRDIGPPSGPVRAFMDLVRHADPKLWAQEPPRRRATA